MNREKGFTLIEIVMVIILLGILAAVAIPRFIDMSGEAKKSSLKGILGGVRGAVAISYANNALKGHVAYPSGTALRSMMGGGAGIPANPYNNKTGVGSAAGANVGWYYDSTTGAFRSITSAGIGADKF